MNWISLIGTAMVAAGVSSVVAVVGSVITARRLRRLQADRLEFDFALAAHKLNLDNTLVAIRAAAERYDRDLSELKRTTDIAERAVAEFYQVKDIVDAVSSPNGSRPPRETVENPELPVFGRIDHIIAEIKQMCRPAKQSIRQ
jgi:hypothetical protein